MTLGADDLHPGSTLGPYEIRSRLGQGGMGVVYLAQDPRLKRQVAIKLLTADLTRDASAKQRFLQEAQAASALDHPNICNIHEINETGDGRLYLVMAYYAGETLKQRIAQGPLVIAEAVDIATQVGQGLAEAHGAGIVHRDIKPANLLITKSGVVKILDFGLAKLKVDPLGGDDATTMDSTAPGRITGTLTYMAPEQLQGEPVDERTDLFAIGVVLYEAVSGRNPFRRKSAIASAAATINDTPAPIASIDSPALERLIRRCLMKPPGDRFQSAGDLVLGLRTALTPSPRPPGEAAAESAPPSSSIAVLPFTDLSPTRDQDYLCDGLAEELINSLARIEGVRIAARSLSFQFRGSAVDLGAVGQRLGVGTVVEGSVRKVEERLRVNVQLVDVADGYRRWSARYDRKLEDIFAIQDEIAEAVATSL